MKKEVANGWYSYTENFLSEEEAAFYSDVLSKSLNWESSRITLFGKSYDTPRLEAFYAEEGQQYAYSGKKLHVNPFTPELATLKIKISDHLSAAGIQAGFNCVLANLYRNGMDSNGWHADNEKGLGTNPLIASLSLGAERRFDLRHNLTREKVSFHLKSGSLLVMGGEMQHFWKHQLAKSTKVSSSRLNLTFRRIY
ncbi:MAG: alpha-ketoglutarate-dependent dioxygenase AlkB family protein [Bacteroidota bacterium]